MNREQAKIIGQLSDEQLKAVKRTQYVKHKKEIIAYGNGAYLEYRLFSNDSWMPCKNPQFSYDRDYRIATPKITFNGVEIDAPIKDREGAPEKVWTVWFGDWGIKPHQVYLKNITSLSGTEWAAEEACQLYCDTHNKMMGVE